MIYFAQDTVSEAIKIGYSAKPAKRLAGLQTANPHKLVMLGMIKGKADDEAALHSQFASHRLHGEWFNGTILESVLEIIASHNQNKVTHQMATEGDAAGDSTPQGVSQVPGLAMKAYSLQLTEQVISRDAEYGGQVEEKLGVAEMLKMQRQFSEGDHALKDEKKMHRVRSMEVIYGYLFRCVLTFEKDVTGPELQQLQRAFHDSSNSTAYLTFFDDDNTVIPFGTYRRLFCRLTPMTGVQGEGFRVSANGEERLNYWSQWPDGSRRLEEVEHPLAKATRIVLRIPG